MCKIININVKGKRNMYKISEISALLEEIKVDKSEGLNSNLVDFVKKIKNIEEEFQKINSNYSIEITPTKNTENEQCIFFVLFYKDKELFHYTSSLPFHKYKEYDAYETESFHALQGSLTFNLEKTVFLNQEKDLYNQIIEDKLINSFLNNEKELKTINESKNSLKVKI
jgi:hypothetical protein